MTTPGECPLAIDGSRTTWNDEKGREVRYATPESIDKALGAVGMAALIGKKIKMPFRGGMLQGTVAEITAEQCEFDDLSRNYPDGFIKRADIFSLIPEDTGE